MKLLAQILAVAALLTTTTVASAAVPSADMNADNLLHAYDAATPAERIIIEQMVLTAEKAFREANSVIVLQRNEVALYCLPTATDFTAKQLIEVVRSEVGRTNFVGKHHFVMSMLHAL